MCTHCLSGHSPAFMVLVGWLINGSQNASVNVCAHQVTLKLLNLNKRSTN